MCIRDRAHIAAAVNTPLISLFGATDHIFWRPWSNNMIQFWAGERSAESETHIGFEYKTAGAALREIERSLRSAPAVPSR